MDEVMPHTIRNQYDKHLTFDALLKAHERASKTKRNSKEVLRFEIDLESNLINVYKKLKNQTYEMGRYREFTIYEPKERIIRSLPYLDRVVHQWYIHEFIKPYIVPRLIYDTYACIDGRGTHKAVDRLQQFMRKMKNKYGSYYILKCDIKGFFYNIDKDVLYAILKKYIKDEKLLHLTKKFVYDDLDTVGIPIGNYTSQYFANIYMNELDHYVKEELKVKYYVRYMDDMILLHREKQYLAECKKKIEKKCNDLLKLELNDKTEIGMAQNGIDFLGYRHILNRKGKIIVKLRYSSKQRMKKHLKTVKKLYEKGIVDEEYVYQRKNAFYNHVKHTKENRKLKNDTFPI